MNRGLLLLDPLTDTANRGEYPIIIIAIFISSIISSIE